MRHKILIVDDVDFSLEYAKGLVVDRISAEILTASNGREAIEMVKKENPNLVLMDLEMPVLTGDEACRIIKSDPVLKKTPIIMLTSSRKEEDLKRCSAAGCDDYFTKPILKIDTFFQKLKEYLDIIIREHPRIPILVDVSFSVDKNSYTGSARDISKGGILIESDTLFLRGKMISLMLTMPDSNKVVEAEGMVVREVKGMAGNRCGMGIKFTDVTLEGRRAISDYIRAHG